MIALSPRLLAVSDMLRGGPRNVDVGTDHAYLPVHLIQSGKCDSVLACDVGELPLQNAARTAEAYGLSDRITLRLSDGLQNVRPEEAEEISVCGMGGTLIVRILSAAAWVRERGRRLVLQPMTHAEDVREFLFTSGFSVTEERVVREDNRLYCCIAASYTAAPPVGEPGVWYFGSGKPEDPDALAYVRKQADRMKKAALALRECGRRPWELERLTAALDYYEKELRL